MLTHLERINRFRSDVPDEFVLDLVRSLVELYQSTWAQTSGLPGSYQRYIVPHLRRTSAEIQFVTLARRRKLRCDTRRNRSKDAHAVVLTKRCAITLSHTVSTSATPRWARFRQDYSKAANYQMPLFEVVEKPILVRLRDPRVYVVICHGYKTGDWRDLGFVYANFLDTGAMQFTGKGIDLIAIAAGVSKAKAAGAEDVQEPGFGVADDIEREQQDTGGGA